MSVVAVRVTPDYIELGADSIRVLGWTQEKDKFAKMFQENDLAVGFCGWSNEGGLFHLYCQTRKPSSTSELGIMHFFSEFLEWYRKNSGDSGAKLDNQYLLIFEERVFSFNHFFVREVTTFYSIGGGSDFALAALHLGHTVKESIAVAIELSIVCEGPINLIRIPKQGNIL